MAKKAKSKKNSKQILTTVLIVMLVLVGVTIAYAATLSSTLNITAPTSVGGSGVWDVHFKSESVTGTASNAETGTTTGIVCGTATSGGNSVTVADTTLSLPGDTCKYMLTIQNASSVRVKLSSMSKIDSGTQCGAISSGAFVCGNITYKLTTDAAGQTPLATNSTIAKSSGSQVVYLTVSHTGNDVVSESLSYSGKGFSLTYVQD